MADYKLTTIDNPWSPFDEYEKWETFDENDKQYYTNEYLARITQMFEDDLELDEETAYELAIDEIVKHNVLGVYRKIDRNEAEKLKKSRNSTEKH